MKWLYTEYNQPHKQTDTWFVQYFSLASRGLTLYVAFFQSQLGLDNVYGQYYDGVLYCTFTRQKGMLGQAELFDLDQDWHIMFANGRAMQVPGECRVNIISKLKFIRYTKCI